MGFNPRFQAPFFTNKTTSMAKRDPNKTARRRIIENMKDELRRLLPGVLKETGLPSEATLNATLGSKNDDFFDLKRDVILSSEQFVNQWLTGLKAAAQSQPHGSVGWIWKSLKKFRKFRKYTLLFLERSYLNHFDELSKNRPSVQDSELWIGQRNAHYGLLVTPRFVHGKWENDKSEIRALKVPYFTIGHVLQAGLVIPGKGKRMSFADVEQYLIFFQETVVRASGSQYEYELAEMYCDYVRDHKSPLDVPLLIPEFRYDGLAVKHIYRLDFLIINPYTLDKTGFELSPWSTHGYLSKTKALTQAKINEMASDNFAKEMRKHRSFFRKHDVTVLIFTDDDLQDLQSLFEDWLLPFLEPKKPQVQLSFQVMEEILSEN
jgi:hypothetical protein